MRWRLFRSAVNYQRSGVRGYATCSTNELRHRSAAHLMPCAPETAPDTHPASELRLNLATAPNRPAQTRHSSGELGLRAPLDLLSPHRDKAEELRLSALLNGLSLKSDTSSQPLLAPSFYRNNEYHIGYVRKNFNHAILDPAAKAVVIQEPTINGEEPGLIGDPDKPGSTPPAYEARHILKIRRWHMNRHKLKKMRKKNKTMLVRLAFVRRRYNNMVIQDELTCIKKDGEQFDALQFVKERLARAKAGGYVQDITKSAEEQPLVPWDEYSMPQGRVQTYERKIFPTLKKKLRIIDKQKAQKKK